MPTHRALFVHIAVSEMHSPYVWNAKGKLFDGIRCYDCSGLVTWSFLRAGGPDWLGTHNTKLLWAACAPTEVLRPGTLVLYGKGGVPDHVMIHLGEGVVLGASGGGSSCTNPVIAKQLGARVKTFPVVDYRKGEVLGYRELPFRDEVRPAA